MSCAKTADRDAVWDAKLDGSREHVLHGNVDALMERGTFWGVWRLAG